MTGQKAIEFFRASTAGNDICHHQKFETSGYDKFTRLVHCDKVGRHDEPSEHAIDAERCWK